MHRERLVVTILFHSSLLWVMGQTFDVELSQSILDRGYYLLTCTVNIVKETNMNSRILLNCPIVDTSICYSNCTPICDQCGLQMINKCDYVERNSGKYLQVSYRINSKLIRKEGQWSCTYRGKSSRPITITAVQEEEAPPQPVVTHEEPEVKPPVPPPIPRPANSDNAIQAIIPTTTTTKRNEIDYHEPMESKKSNGDANTQRDVRNSGSVSWMSPPQPGIVYALIILLSLSLFINFIFLVRCCLVQRYITRFRLGYEKQKFLETILCFKRSHVKNKNRDNANRAPPNGPAVAASNYASKPNHQQPPPENENSFTETGHLLHQSTHSESSSRAGGVMGHTGYGSPGAIALAYASPQQYNIEYSPNAHHMQFNSVPRHIYRTPLAPALPILTGRQFSVPSHHTYSSVPPPPQVLSGVTSNMDDFQSISTGSIMIEDNDSLSTHSNPVSDRGLRNQRFMLQPVVANGSVPTSTPTSMVAGLWPITNGSSGRTHLDPNWLLNAQKAHQGAFTATKACYAPVTITPSAFPASYPNGYIRASGNAQPIGLSNIPSTTAAINGNGQLSVIEEGNATAIASTDALWHAPNESHPPTE